MTNETAENVKTQKLYKRLAGLVGAFKRCEQSGNAEWSQRHREVIRALVKTHMPSGSGWDNGTSLDLERSTEEALCFTGAFHHMNDTGMYDGWTDHAVIVRPSLAFDIRMSITGRNRNDIKDYLHEMFDCALRAEVA